MKEAAATIAGVRSQAVTFVALPRALRHGAAVLLAIALGVAALGALENTEGPFGQLACTRSGKGKMAMVRISVVIATVVTLSVQAGLAFQKYHFNNGLVLGTTLAAVDWYEDTARRKGLPQSRVALILIATNAATLTLIVQQAAHVLAR